MSELINDKKNMFKANRLTEKIEKLHNLCFPKIHDVHTKISKYTLSKIHSMLCDITKNADKRLLTSLGPQKIISCAVKIISFFDENIYKQFKLSKPKHRVNYKSIKKCYDGLLTIFLQNQSQKVIEVTIAVINQENLWQFKTCCYDLLIPILMLSNNNLTNVINELLNIIENEIAISENIYNTTEIILDIFYTYFYLNVETLNAVFQKILNIYHDTININSWNEYLDNTLEIFIYNTINNLSNDYLIQAIYKISFWMMEFNIPDKYIWKYGKIVEHAAYIYKTNKPDIILQEGILTIIMQMICSSNSLISLLGNRIFQQLIDRNHNKLQFEAPKIFLQNGNYDIKLNNGNNKDATSFRRNRKLIHDCFIANIMKHSAKKLNLESVYCTICLLAVEMRTEPTTAAIVCLVMNIQKLVLENSSIDHEVSYNVHATLLAIFTLICWIHNATILYSYVCKIMMKRAQWAPHLNPPLKTHNVFVVHYIHWNKQELFFVDWEIHFGLWKCFRSHIYKNKAENNDNST